ncbi:hypothetical protein [Sphingobium yanoikuyae]
MSDTEMMPWEKVADPSYFRKVMGNIVALGLGPKTLAQPMFGSA